MAGQFVVSDRWLASGGLKKFKVDGLSGYGALFFTGRFPIFFSARCSVRESESMTIFTSKFGAKLDLH